VEDRFGLWRNKSLKSKWKENILSIMVAVIAMVTAGRDVPLTLWG